MLSSIPFCAYEDIIEVNRKERKYNDLEIFDRFFILMSIKLKIYFSSNYFVEGNYKN